jgi:hypothetical protein
METHVAESCDLDDLYTTALGLYEKYFAQDDAPYPTDADHEHRILDDEFQYGERGTPAMDRQDPPQEDPDGS